MQTCWNIIFRQILYALNIVRLQTVIVRAYWGCSNDLRSLMYTVYLQKIQYKLLAIYFTGCFRSENQGWTSMLRSSNVMKSMCVQNFSFCIYLYTSTYKTWCDDLVVIRACTTKLKVICIGILITTVKKKIIINRNIYN